MEPESNEDVFVFNLHELNATFTLVFIDIKQFDCPSAIRKISCIRRSKENPPIFIFLRQLKHMRLGRESYKISGLPEPPLRMISSISHVLFCV